MAVLQVATIGWLRSTQDTQRCLQSSRKTMPVEICTQIWNIKAFYECRWAWNGLNIIVKQYLGRLNVCDICRAYAHFEHNMLDEVHVQVKNIQAAIQECQTLGDIIQVGWVLEYNTCCYNWSPLSIHFWVINQGIYIIYMGTSEPGLPRGPVVLQMAQFKVWCVWRL